MANLIPEGHYRAVAVPVDTDMGNVWAQFTTAKSGNDQVVIVFELLDAPYTGRRLTWFGTFTKDTVERIFKSLRYCGFKGDDLMSLPEQAIHCEVSITVAQSTGEDGVTRNKVEWVNQAGGGGIKIAKPMAQNDLRTLAARLKSVAKGVPEVAGKKAERTTPAPSGRTPPPSNGSAWDEPSPTPLDPDADPFA